MTKHYTIHGLRVLLGKWRAFLGRHHVSSLHVGEEDFLNWIEDGCPSFDTGHGFEGWLAKRQK